MKIYPHKFLKDFDNVYVEIDPSFTDFIRERIYQRFGSLKAFNDKILKINYQTFKWAFKKRKYHNFKRILRIAGFIGVPEGKIFEEVRGFYHWGSHRKSSLIVPTGIHINQSFVEGYALYLAEGDTGFSGLKKSRKLRFTNSELGVVNHYIVWLKTFFPNCCFSVTCFSPKGGSLSHQDKTTILKELNIKGEQLKIKKGFYNK
ncbi:MAG: hypothetical protein R6U32_05270 [Candidatus Woesearchaeota archaeon]